MPSLSSITNFLRTNKLRSFGAGAELIDKRVAAMAGKAVSRDLGIMAGRATRGGVRTAASAAWSGAGASMSVGAWAGNTVVGAVQTTGRMFRGAMRMPMIGIEHGLPFIDRNRSLLTWQKGSKIPFTNRHFFTPMASRRVAAIAGVAGLAAGVAGGIKDYHRQRGWNLTTSMNTGTVEVERDNFMGATGALTLSMYRQRYGRPAPQEVRQSGLTAAAMSLNREEMVHALHWAHMAHVGI